MLCVICQNQDRRNEVLLNNDNEWKINSVIKISNEDILKTNRKKKKKKNSGRGNTYRKQMRRASKGYNFLV